MTENRNDVVVSLALTLDGYIARPDGSVDYLERYEIPEFDYHTWFAAIGSIVMGSTSYLQAVEWGWHWGDRPTLVLTSQSGLPVPDGADIAFESGDTCDAIRRLKERILGPVWVFGGGEVATAAMNGGVVDVLDIVVMPEAIVDGIPMFTAPVAVPMTLAEVTPFACGAVRLVYDVGAAAE